MKVFILVSLAVAAMEASRAQGCCSTDQDCLEMLSPADEVSVWSVESGNVGDRPELDSGVRVRPKESPYVIRLPMGKVGPARASAHRQPLSPLPGIPEEESLLGRLHELNRLSRVV